MTWTAAGAWSQLYQTPPFSTPLRIPDCEGIDVEPMAGGTVHYEKYKGLVRVIKKFIRDEANRENPD